jgi:hypothetical protein
MFNTLDEEIEKTEDKSPNQTERVVRYLPVALLSVIVFGGIFMGIWFLEY